jgi:hypothetical protein
MIVFLLLWREGERRIHQPSWWEVGLVTLLITACSWTKLTTVLLAIPFIFLVLLPRMKSRPTSRAPTTRQPMTTANEDLPQRRAFIQSRTDSDDLISSMKDVGLLAERRYVENYSAVYGGEKQARRLIERWEPGKIRLIVFTEGIPP